MVANKFDIKPSGIIQPALFVLPKAETDKPDEPALHWMAIRDLRLIGLALLHAGLGNRDTPVLAMVYRVIRERDQAQKQVLAQRETLFKLGVDNARLRQVRRGDFEY